VTRLAALIAAALVLVGLAVGAYIVVTNPGDDQFADCRRTQVASGRAEIGGPFELTDASGARITDALLIDRPTLLYFGYSYCPDFCPTDLARNAAAADLLAERGMDVRLAFITIDPARDTPEVMGDYATAIHPDMIGLSGTAEEIDAAARAYRVFYRKAGDDPDYYLMDHSTFTYLMAPGVGFLDFFRSDLDAETVADGAACFISRL
jgi:protein SCO1/2